MAAYKIRWEVFFLPSHIMEFTNFSASVELYTGSGRISRGSGLRLRGILFRRPLRPFGSVFRSSLLPVSHSRCVQSAAHHVIAYAGQVFHAAATDQHDGVFLQIVSHSRDVRGHFDAVG